MFGGAYQLGALLLYGALVGGVYGALLFIPYGFGDDYLYLAASVTGNLRDVVYPIVAGGRPVYALLLRLAMPEMSHVSDLWALRLDSLLGITLLAWVLYQTLLRAGLPWIIAWITPLFIVMLPAYQVFAGWSITAFFPFSAVLAGMAVIMADRAFQASGLRRYAEGLGAVALLLVSVSLYQPTAMVFWVFAAVVLFVHQRSVNETIKLFALLVAMMAFALICDFLLARVLPGLLYAHPYFYSRATVTDNVTSKLVFFLQPLLESLNLFHLVDKTQLVPAALIALAVGLLILTGLPRFFRGTLSTRLQKTALALCLIPLAYLPNLLVAENFGSFRSQVAMESLIALYAVLGGIGYCRRWPVLSLRAALPLLAVLTIASMAYALHNVTAEFAIPQEREYQAVVAQLKAAPLAQINTIDVVPSLTTDRLSTEVHHDEFGLPTSAETFYVVPITTCAMQDVAPKDLSRIIIYEANSSPAKTAPNVLVINMHDVLQQLHHPKAVQPAAAG